MLFGGFPFHPGDFRRQFGATDVNRASIMLCSVAFIIAAESMLSRAWDRDEKDLGVSTAFLRCFSGGLGKMINGESKKAARKGKQGKAKARIAPKSAFPRRPGAPAGTQRVAFRAEVAAQLFITVTEEKPADSRASFSCSTVKGVS